MKILQKVIVNRIEINKDDAVIAVFAYRILQAERLLSVLPLNLNVEVGRIPRSAQNPYGLRLEFTEANMKKEVTP